MTLRRFGKRLHHDIPSWVQPGNFFHLRVRVAREQKDSLTQPTLAEALLDSARFYHEKGRWWPGLFVLMLDHWHAPAAFPRQEDMSAVISDWKRWQNTRHIVFSGKRVILIIARARTSVALNSRTKRITSSTIPCVHSFVEDARTGVGR